MNSWVAVALLIAALVFAPAFIGVLAGRRIGGLRGRVAGGGLPVLLWSAYIFFELARPSSFDYGPQPEALFAQWVTAVAISGSIGLLASANSDRTRLGSRVGA